MNLNFVVPDNTITQAIIVIQKIKKKKDGGYFSNQLFVWQTFACLMVLHAAFNVYVS